MNLIDRLLKEHFSIYYQVRAPLVFKMLAINQKDKILEIGCHQGLWSMKIAGEISFLVGLDITLRDLLVARKNARSQGHINASFVLASAEFLPFKDASFNKVLGVDVIEHLPDDKKAVLEAGRTLKPKGRIVLTTLKKERRHYLKRILFKGHLREYSEETLEALFAGTELKVKKKAEFYKFFSTIAWEIHGMSSRYRVLPHLLAPLLVLVCKLDFLLSGDIGGGIAVIGEKR